MRIIHFYRHLSQSDRRIVFWTITGALLLALVPYLFGAVIAGRDYTYLWLNPIGTGDTNVYFSFIYQAAHGAVFFQNLHTSELQYGSLFNPLWLVLGWIAGLFRLSPALVFHAARALFGVIFLLIFSYCTSYIFSDSRRRNIALVLAAFSSGVGVFFSMDVSFWDAIRAMMLLPSDQWISESNTFLTLFHSPLFILSQALLLLIMWRVVFPARHRPTFVLGCMIFMLALVHPYDIVTLAAVLPAFLLMRLMVDYDFTVRSFWKSLWLLFRAGCFALPPMVAFLVANRLEPAISGWTKQNITISPLPHSYILGYGLVLAFAVLGFLVLRKRITPVRLLVMTWAFVSIVLLYLPMQINRRMSNGLHLPLVLLAAAGIDVLWKWMEGRHWRGEILRHTAFAAVGFVVAFGLFFSTLTVVVKTVYWQKEPASSMYHISKEVAMGMDWLGAHAPRDAVILGHSYHGNIIPARTGLRVFIGHGHQTINWSEKRRITTTWFFRTNRDDQHKQTFLTSNSIDYIFFGSLEDGMGDFQPNEKKYLEVVYQNTEVSIYRVRAGSEVSVSVPSS